MAGYLCSMLNRSKVSDYSPLFGGMLGKLRPLRIIDRDGTSVLSIFGGAVIGSRRILEKVRDGIVRNGGPQHITESNSKI